jgi:hypothetical protein
MLHTNTIRQSMIATSKRMLVAAALMLTVGITSSFARSTNGAVAGDPAAVANISNNINTRVQTAFQKDFNKSTLLAFEISKDYTKLTLKMNEVVMTAFYSGDGQLLAVTRNIKSNQLPIQLLMELKKNYNGYWISDLFELTADDHSNYYITMENADVKVTLRSSNNEGWEKYEKANKD